MSGQYWDVSWNPATGCTPVSLGCEHCWAERMARRFKPCVSCKENWRDECDPCEPEDYFRPTFHPDRLDQPLHWRKPRRVAVCFMGDLFHEAFTDEQIDAVFLTTIRAFQHTYVMLTKRPERARDYLRGRAERLNNEPGNVWLGATICNQEEADRNIPVLLDTPAAVRWVSIEPMLGPVDFGHFTPPGEHDPRCTVFCCHEDCPTSVAVELPQIQWVVLGGETGPGARPMQPEWALDVYRQCKEAGVAFYFKQVGSAFPGWRGESDVLAECEDMGATREFPVVTS